jgi:hypothetical protein
MLSLISFLFDSLYTMKSALFLVILAVLSAAPASGKVPQQWVDNAASFIAGGVGGTVVQKRCQLFLLLVSLSHILSLFTVIVQHSTLTIIPRQAFARSLLATPLI